jgi:hypothetical protein
VEEAIVKEEVEVEVQEAVRAAAGRGQILCRITSLNQFSKADRRIRRIL